MSLRDYLDGMLRKPLGITHFTYGLPKQERNRVAMNSVAGMRVRFPVSTLIRRALLAGLDEVVTASKQATFMDAVIPVGNLYATAEELTRFYQMLLGGVEYDGHRVMEPSTVARVSRPCNRLSVDRMIMVPMRYSEGFMLGSRGFSPYGLHTADAFGPPRLHEHPWLAQPPHQTAVTLLTTGNAYSAAICYR